MRQVDTAPGAIGYSFRMDLFRLQLHTLSAWQDEAQLWAFVRADPHAAAAQAYRTGMRAPSVFVQWEAWGADLPLVWSEALRRQRAA
jgi:hypothetical protein